MEKMTGSWGSGGKATLAGGVQGRPPEKVTFVLNQTIERSPYQATLPHNVHLEISAKFQRPRSSSFQCTFWSLSGNF